METYIQEEIERIKELLAQVKQYNERIEKHNEKIYGVKKAPTRKTIKELLTDERKQSNEALVEEIVNYLKKHELTDSVIIYYNGLKRDLNNDTIVDFDWDDIPFEYKSKLFPNFGLDGSTWNHRLLDFGSEFKRFDELISKHDLLFEHGDSWNFGLYPVSGDYSAEYERFEAGKPTKETVYLYTHMSDNEKEDIPNELFTVQKLWKALADNEVDRGSCVIGEGMEFSYLGTKYKMPACSCHQGSLTWEKHVPLIKDLLNTVGCEDVYFNYGQLD